jgi:hypothetical protein
MGDRDDFPTDVRLRRPAESNKGKEGAISIDEQLTPYSLCIRRIKPELVVVETINSLGSNKRSEQ